MRELFRKHGKIIMAIVGVVLMFVFALPTFRGITPEQYGNLKVATLDGRKITNNDITNAQGEVTVLTGLGFLRDPRQSPGILPEFPYSGLAVSALSGEDQDKGLYWLLLTDEASHYDNTTVNDAEVDRVAAGAGLTAADVQRFLNDKGTGANFLRIALSHLEMVENYIRFLADSTPRPVSSVELAGDRELRKVDVKFASVDGTQDYPKIPDPSADDLKKLFDLYKDVVRTPALPPDAQQPGTLPPEIAGHHYPFGYKYPDRVTLEYLAFNRATLRALIKPTNDDYSAAFAYYQQNPAEFTTTAPASAPATAPANSLKPWDQVKQQLVDQQIDIRTDQAMANIIRDATDWAQEPWKNNPDLPRDKWVAYQEIATRIAADSASNGYKPEYHTTEKGAGPDKRDLGLMGSEALAKLPGIGDSTYLLAYAQQQAPVPFSLLAVHVQELVPPNSKDPLGRLNLQAGTEGPVVKDKDGNQYVYRVTTADKTHEPASMQEVQSQVIDDCLKKTDYEKCVADIQSLLAKNEGVSDVAAQYHVPVQTADALSRVNQDLPDNVRTIRDFVKTAFTLHEPPPAKAGAPAPAPGTTVLPDDSTLHCYALELVRYTAATGAEFGKEVQVLMQEQDPAIEKFWTDYLKLETLESRLKYISTVAPPKKPTPPAAPAPAATKGAS